MVDFTIMVLMYGNHFPLAKRCLDSIKSFARPEKSFHLRLGLNEVCDQTQRYAGLFNPEYMVASPTNRHKYPVLRDLLYAKKVETPFVMWFDDDSFLTPQAASKHGWLAHIAEKMKDFDFMGASRRIRWQGNQPAWVRAQPWYAGKDPADRDWIKFITGGWWVARTEILYKYNYPWPELDHRGGDTMWGECCFQQDVRVANYNHGVCGNADMQGRYDASPKRGFDQRPLGFNYVPQEVKPQ